MSSFSIIFFKCEKASARASSDRFCPCPCPCLSLSQISSHILNLLCNHLCTNLKHNNNTSPVPTHPYPKNSKRTPKEFKKNSQRIPKGFQKIQKNYDRIYKKFTKKSQVRTPNNTFSKRIPNEFPKNKNYIKIPDSRL